MTRFLNAGFIDNLTSVDIGGLNVCEDNRNAFLLAGAASGSQVYFSRDGGANWTKSRKPPTGQGCTGVVMAPDFTDTGTAFVTTSSRAWWIPKSAPEALSMWRYPRVSLWMKQYSCLLSIAIIWSTASGGAGMPVKNGKGYSAAPEAMSKV
jgi:hypothetical protein